MNTKKVAVISISILTACAVAAVAAVTCVKKFKSLD